MYALKVPICSERKIGTSAEAWGVDACDVSVTYQKNCQHRSLPIFAGRFSDNHLLLHSATVAFS